MLELMQVHLHFIMNNKRNNSTKSEINKNLACSEKVLVENDDFYINTNGFVVFTSEYHKKRGYCCKNNCLNCPYFQNEIK